MVVESFLLARRMDIDGAGHPHRSVALREADDVDCFILIEQGRRRVANLIWLLPAATILPEVFPSSVPAVAAAGRE